jgi:hypothetical protein
MNVLVTRTLLVILAFALAFVSIPIGLTPSQPWMLVQGRLASAEAIVELNLARSHDEEIPVETINAWLAGELAPDDAVARAWGEPPRADPWNRPLRATTLEEADDGKSRVLGFYSLGQDGQSQTAGNDADDLNTWNEACTAWYAKSLRRQMLIARALWAAIGTPFVYAALFFIGSLIAHFSPREDRNATPASMPR